MEKMTEDRLAELAMLLDWHVVNPGIVGVDLSQGLTRGLRELLNEIDRLRAENEREKKISAAFKGGANLLAAELAEARALIAELGSIK